MEARLDTVVVSLDAAHIAAYERARQASSCGAAKFRNRFFAALYLAVLLAAVLAAAPEAGGPR